MSELFITIHGNSITTTSNTYTAVMCIHYEVFFMTLLLHEAYNQESKTWQCSTVMRTSGAGQDHREYHTCCRFFASQVLNFLKRWCSRSVLQAGAISKASSQSWFSQQHLNVRASTKIDILGMSASNWTCRCIDLCCGGWTRLGLDRWGLHSNRSTSTKVNLQMHACTVCTAHTRTPTPWATATEPRSA